MTTFIEPAATVADLFGRSVALSADGTEVLIGTAPNMREGKVYLYQVSDDGTWPAKPEPSMVFDDPDGSSRDQFGIEVALSAAGNAAFVLNHPIGSDNETTSGIYLFEKTAGQWSDQPAGEFLVPDTADFDTFIVGFALSGDGNTLFIAAAKPLGRSQGLSCCRVVLVYTRKNGTWNFTSPVNILEAPDAPASPYNSSFGGDTLHGVDIAPSLDGSIVLIGDPQIPRPSPPPPYQTPTYGGPGVAFAFETTNDWQQSEPPPPPPPPPGPPPEKPGGGGSFGWPMLVAFLALLGRRRRLF